MFVQNCAVDMAEVITAPAQASKHRKRKHGRAPAAPPPSGGETNDVCHAVKCEECGTVVAAMDRDEVYHFYNVVPSHT